MKNYSIAALGIMMATPGFSQAINTDLKVDSIHVNAQGRGEFSAYFSGKGVKELMLRLPQVNKTKLGALRALSFSSPSAALSLSCNTHTSDESGRKKTWSTCDVYGYYTLPNAENGTGVPYDYSRDVLPGLVAAQKSGVLAAHPLPVYRLKEINLDTEREGSTAVGDYIRIQGGQAYQLNEILPNSAAGAGDTTIRSMKFSDGRSVVTLTCVAPTQGVMTAGWKSQVACAARVIK